MTLAAIRMHNAKVHIPVSSRYTVFIDCWTIRTFISSRTYVTGNTIQRHRCSSPAYTIPARTANSIRCCQSFSCAWPSRIARNALLLSLKTRCVTVGSIWTGIFIWSLCANRTIVARRANTSICNVWKGAIILKINMNFLKKIIYNVDYVQSTNCKLCYNISVPIGK